MFLVRNNAFYSLTIMFLLLLSGCSTTSNTPSESLSLSQARYGHATVNDGENLYIIAGSYKKKFLSSIEIINPVSGKKKILNDILIPRRYFSAIWDGKHSIYIVGGVSFKNNILRYERKVEVFDTITHQVTFAESLPSPTRTNTAVYLDDKIYVFGGTYLPKVTRLPSPTPIVAVLDISKNKWHWAKRMPMAKSTKAVVKDGFIYTIGGYDTKSALNTFERFDPKKNTWQTMPPLPAKISAHSVSMVGDKLFIFGDYKDMNATYAYDFTTQAWEKMNIEYKASRHNAATTMGDTTYVTGGNTGANGPYLNYIQTFKLGTESTLLK